MSSQCDLNMGIENSSYRGLLFVYSRALIRSSMCIKKSSQRGLLSVYRRGFTEVFRLHIEESSSRCFMGAKKILQTVITWRSGLLFVFVHI